MSFRPFVLPDLRTSGGDRVLSSFQRAKTDVASLSSQPKEDEVQGIEGLAGQQSSPGAGRSRNRHRGERLAAQLSIWTFIPARWPSPG